MKKLTYYITAVLMMAQFVMAGDLGSTYLTNKKGRTIEAELQNVKDHRVKANLENGKEIEIDLKSLSDKDQKYLMIIEKLLVEKGELLAISKKLKQKLRKLEVESVEDTTGEDSLFKLLEDMVGEAK